MCSNWEGHWKTQLQLGFPIAAWRCWWSQVTISRSGVAAGWGEWIACCHRLLLKDLNKKYMDVEWVSFYIGGIQHGRWAYYIRGWTFWRTSCRQLKAMSAIGYNSIILGKGAALDKASKLGGDWAYAPTTISARCHLEIARCWRPTW